MEVKLVFDFIKANSFIAVTLAFFGLGAMVAVKERIGFYFWYLVVMLLGFAAAFLTNNQLYFYCFMLGMLTAFAEFIGKFSDEPLKSLSTPHALLYHLFNGVVAALALKFLLIFGSPITTPVEQLKVVMVAGLGSMVMMRSKLFNLKVGGEDVAFGPDQIVKVFFRFMEAAIDRVRAQSRVEFVKEKLKDIDFDAVYDYCNTMLDAAQALDTTEKDKAKKAMKDIRTGEIKDKQLRSYSLGFLLLNQMGEDFVSRLFDNAPPEWKIRAPIPEKKEERLLDKIPILGSKAQTVLFMAYGSNMSSRRFRERLGWLDVEETKFAEITAPKKATLTGYRLEFNKPHGESPDPEGLANIVEDQNAAVEGVVYQLTQPALEYLDVIETGYKRKQVSVTVNAKNDNAMAYVAETTREGLKPTKALIEMLVEGAREHGLDESYIEKLQSRQTL